MGAARVVGILITYSLSGTAGQDKLKIGGYQAHSRVGSGHRRRQQGSDGKFLHDSTLAYRPSVTLKLHKSQ